MQNRPVYSYAEATKACLEYFKGNANAAKNFLDKYAMRDNEDNLVEKTPHDMHVRIAKEFARIEKSKFKNPLDYETILEYLANFSRIVPQGSPMYGIGNDYQITSLSNCFVIPSPVDSYAGILKADQELVQISKRRGGTGGDISELRPEGATTHNAARSSTGILPFMERFSNSIREVGQNGRRGALMVTCSVHHPQILDFVTVKMDPRKVTGANISVRLTDEFLNAVQNDHDYELRWPVDAEKPKVSKRISARKVWKEIIKSAHGRGEPGLLFWDNIIRESPADCYASKGFRTISTNPCCFAKNTDVYVITNHGVKEIKQVRSNDLIWINENQSWATTSGYFEAGVATTYQITFENGDELMVTENHKFCTIQEKRIGTKIIRSESNLKPLCELKTGDKIAIHNTEVADMDWSTKGTHDEGMVMGWLSGDGCLSYHDDAQTHPTTILTFWQQEHDAGQVVMEAMKRMQYDLSMIDNSVHQTKMIKSTKFTEDFSNKYQTNPWLFKSDDKPLPFLLECSEEFVRGYISAYFSADGSVTCNHEACSYSLQLCSINKSRLKQIRSLLMIFGIKSSIGLMRKAGIAEFKNSGGKYQTKDCWRITITGVENIMRYHTHFGFICQHKQSALESIVHKFHAQRTSKCQNYTTVKNIQLIGEKETGCIEVDTHHKFTADGIISGNSEIPLSAYDSCRLLLLNLYPYVKKPYTNKAFFDYDEFYKDAQIAQRLMDDMVDMEIECIDRIIKKIADDPEDESIKFTELNLWKNVRQSCINGRRTGTGITALGDVMAALGLQYASDESLKETDRIYRTLKLGAYRGSVDMAKELGAFPAWDHNLEKNNPFLLRIAKEDPELYEDMKQYGRRNISLLTTPPAGTVSTVTQTTSGIEPLFALSYTRKKKVNPGDVNSRVDEITETGDAYQKFDVYHPKIKDWMAITGQTDPLKSPWAGSCADDINWQKRVQMQALANKHIDHAISSTLNLPEDISVDVVAKIYEEAWRSGCKGITVYRKNSRTGILVDKKDDTAKECTNCEGASNELKDAINRPTRITGSSSPKRPKILECDIHRSHVEGKDWLFFVGKYHNQPYEVFGGENKGFEFAKKYTTGFIEKDGIKDGRTTYDLILGDLKDAANQQKFTNIAKTFENYDKGPFTRAISLSLRHGIPLKHIVNQITKDEESDLFAFNKAMARVLKKYIAEGEHAGITCPECHSNTSVTYRNGCPQCPCGWSSCS